MPYRIAELNGNERWCCNVCGLDYGDRENAELCEEVVHLPELLRAMQEGPTAPDDVQDVSFED